MKNTLGGDARLVIKQITLVRCGIGLEHRALQLSVAGSEGGAAQEQRHRRLSHCVLRGRHQGGRKNDLHAKNVKTMMGPIPITEGPAAGQAIVYFNAPWGLRLEAISYPKGMAYEKDAATILWTPRPGQVRLTYFTDSLCSTVLDSRARTLARSSRLVFLG